MCRISPGEKLACIVFSRGETRMCRISPGGKLACIVFSRGEARMCHIFPGEKSHDVWSACSAGYHIMVIVTLCAIPSIICPFALCRYAATPPSAWARPSIKFDGWSPRGCHARGCTTPRRVEPSGACCLELPFCFVCARARARDKQNTKNARARARTHIQVLDD